MDAQRWRRIKDILQDVLELEPGARDTFLDEVCAGDDLLRAEVLRLIPAETGGFLDASVVLETKDEPAQKPPDWIEGYRIESELGRGGMGVVYAAVRRDDFHKRVAVKVLPWERASQDLKARFHRERQILAGLSHPHIAMLLDGGATRDGLPYLVMEYVEGTAIDEWCDTQKLTIRERVALVVKVCHALQFVHRNLIMHRDLKPGNILVSSDGVPKLLDFGIAKLCENHEEDQTEARTMVFTPGFASPEQLQGKQVTTATDIYSMGLVLYYLLCGRLPREMSQGNTPVTGATRIRKPVHALSLGRDGVSKAQQDELCANRGCDLRYLKKALSGDLETIVLTALQDDPERRYGSALQMAEDLERFLGDYPIQARRDSPIYTFRKFVMRHKAATAISGLSLALMLGFMLVLMIAFKQVRLERDTAREVTSFLEDIFQAGNPYDLPHRDLAQRTMTARELLDQAHDRLARQEDVDPLFKARISFGMGKSYYHLYQYDAAGELLAEALELRTANLGADHPETIENRFWLGKTEAVHSKWDNADQLLESSFEAGKSFLPPEELMEQRAFMAWAFYESGRYDRIMDLAAEVEGYQGTDKGYIALLNMIAMVHHKKHEYEEAEALYSQALALSEQHLGRTHPLSARLIENLGVLYRRQRNYDAAERHFQEALSIKQVEFGDDHFGVAHAWYNLGLLRLGQERFEEAEPMLRRALEIGRAALGESNGRVADYLNSLSILQLHTGRLEACEQTRSQALAVRLVLYGPQHTRVGESLFNMGNLNMRQGKPEEAVWNYRAARNIFQESFGANHTHIPLCNILLAEALAETGALIQAHDHAVSAIADLSAGKTKRHISLLEEAVQVYEDLSCRMD